MGKVAKLIAKELDSTPKKIGWPQGYEWKKPPFILAAAKDLTAEDIVMGQRGGFFKNVARFPNRLADCRSSLIFSRRRHAGASRNGI